MFSVLLVKILSFYAQEIVAVALAFGLGGREAAGKQLDYWFSQLRKEDDNK